MDTGCCFRCVVCFWVRCVFPQVYPYRHTHNFSSSLPAVQFFKGVKPLITDIEQMKGLDLQKLAVPAGGASEIILRKFLPKNYSDPKTIPWIRATSLPETMELLENGTAKYVFTFDKFVRHVIAEKNLCDRFILAPLAKKEIGGWYYANSIPQKIRLRIDQAISEQHLARVPSRVGRKYGDSPLDCGSEPENVGVWVMLVILLLPVLPLLMCFYCVYVYSVCRDWSFTRLPTEDDSQSDVEGNVTGSVEGDGGFIAQADSSNAEQAGSTSPSDDEMPDIERDAKIKLLLDESLVSDQDDRSSSSLRQDDIENQNGLSSDTRRDTYPPYQSPQRH